MNWSFLRSTTGIVSTIYDQAHSISSRVVLSLSLVFVLFSAFRCPSGDPELSIQPEHLYFGPSETQQQLYINNAGNANGIFTIGVEEMIYSMEANYDWIMLDHTKGTCKGDDTRTCAVTINREVLLPGITPGQIYFFSNGGRATVNIKVEKIVIVPCSITITSPVYADLWEKWGYYTIQWKHTDKSGFVDIELYKDSGYLCTIVSSTPNDGSYVWMVNPCGEGTDPYQIRIADSEDADCYSLSSEFMITVNEVDEVCPLEITSPSSGNVWTEGEVRAIQWYYPDTDVEVRIYLCTFSNCLCHIATTTNDGSYYWTVDDCGGGTASDYQITILIIDPEESDCLHISDTFTLITQPAALRSSSSE